MYISRGLRLLFSKNIVFFCLKIFFTFTNSVDPDEMQHHAAFHLGLHCLKYSFRVTKLNLFIMGSDWTGDREVTSLSLTEITLLSP